MSRCVVVSQSMYFPWTGLLEQVRLAEIFVHYDDVQFARGFLNRVQVKTDKGCRWITVPLRDYHRGQKIDEILVDDRVDWRQQHRDILRQACRQAPFRDEMLALVDSVFGRPFRTLADVSRASLLALVEYFDLRSNRRFLDSRDLGIKGSGSQRLLDIVVAAGGATYLTGHGARNYLDHALFERAGISVQYMNYRCIPYPQLHGLFTPYVSSLDLIANCGKQGISVITSQALDWRQFLNEPA
jgi:hypothetical protein